MQKTKNAYKQPNLTFIAYAEQDVMRISGGDQGPLDPLNNGYFL